MSGKVDHRFWAGKKVFLTGHTGFKGGWLTIWLAAMGAKITGYSLSPITDPNLFNAANIESLCDHSYIRDVRDLDGLRDALVRSSPDIVIHMAAQPLVRHSYENPIETYATNVMGTVNVLEAIRSCPMTRAVLIVTTDKCYENREWIWGYRENEPLGGYDPYSSSKACAELVTSAYRQSFFPSREYKTHKVAIASARAGNVIGGGDWSKDRLIPDAIEAFEANQPLLIRNPSSTRPWQHVLEPLSGYLMLIQSLYKLGPDFGSEWNFGPVDADNRSVEEVVSLAVSSWGTSARWEKVNTTSPHEAYFLKLDCSKASVKLGWTPTWSLEIAIQKTMQWHKAYRAGENLMEITRRQISDFQK